MSTKTLNDCGCRHCNVPREPIAIVIGGGAGVQDELKAALELCSGKRSITLAVNDMIPRAASIDHAVSLHTDRLAGWLYQRRRAGLPPVPRVWGQVPRAWITDVIGPDNSYRESGSSGFLATRIALDFLNLNRVILCGVPMDTSHHFLRKTDWLDADKFRTCWQRNMTRLKCRARSFGGWTASELGTPDEEFING